MLAPIAARAVSPFGERTIAGRPDYHSGIDYAAPAGTPVRAAAAGVVRNVYSPGQLNRYGLTVIIEHPASPANLFTLYAHLGGAFVKPGQTVAAGETIAAVGDTAGTREEPDKRTDRPHLHFELLTRWPPRGIDLDRIDPAPYLTDGAEVLRSPARSVAGGGAFVALLLVLWYQHKRKRRHAVTHAGARAPDANGDRIWAN